MTLQSDIASDVQQSAVGDIIFLYELYVIGSNQVLYFTQAINEDFTKVTFNAVDYLPIQMEVSGFEVKGDGTMPRPTIRVSNATLTFAAHVFTFDDLVGSKMIRRRTLKKYLDGESEANPAAEFPQEIFKINQKTAHTKDYMEFELASYMDLQGESIPKRQIVRDFCSHIYRIYNSETKDFDYSLTTCPYTDIYNFDRLTQNRSSKTQDFCGKKLKDCEARFAGVRAGGAGGTIYIQNTQPGAPSEGDDWLDTGQTPNIWFRYTNGAWATLKPDPLPTRAYPGVGRFRS